MKTIKITYWISTGMIALMMIFSAFAYLTKPEIEQGFHHLGFPDYFRVELAIAKFIAALVLIIPLPARIREWAYAGLGICFISASIAHGMSGDPIVNSISPLVVLSVLILSNVMYHKLHSHRVNTAA